MYKDIIGKVGKDKSNQLSNTLLTMEICGLVYLSVQFYPMLFHLYFNYADRQFAIRKS